MTYRIDGNDEGVRFDSGSVPFDRLPPAEKPWATPEEWHELLRLGTNAMHGLERMLEEMVPLIAEITAILEGGNVQLRTMELADAVRRRNIRTNQPRKGISE